MVLVTVNPKKYVSRAGTLERVEQTLRTRIASGHWLPGVMLPSRRSLAEEFDVDLSTLQRAIAPLLADGTLLADGGRGTFVSGTGTAPGCGSVSVDPVRVGTLGIIAGYDTSRVGAFDVAGVGTRDILRALEQEFANAGGRTVFFNLFRPDAPWITVGEAEEALLEQGIEALAIVGIQTDPLLGDIAQRRGEGPEIPVIYISGTGLCQPRMHIYYDQRQAGYQAAEYLLRIGCRSLLFVVPFSAPWLEERVEGAGFAVRDARLTAETLRVYPASHPLAFWSSKTEEVTAETIRQLFQENALAEGVLTPNDGVAHLFLEIASEYNRLPGRDFALIGFDDLPQSSFCGLSSIRPPFGEMGREAGRLLLRHLGGEKVYQQICLRSHLMVRSSTAAFTARWE